MKKWILVLCSINFIPHFSWADVTVVETLPPVAAPAPVVVSTRQVCGHWYAALSAGNIYPHVTHTDNYVATGPGWPDDHYRLQDATSRSVFSVGLGYIWGVEQFFMPYYSLGLTYTYAYPNTLKGTIDQYSIDFVNYRFKQRLQRQSLFATVKASFFRWHCLMPYLTGGAGPSFLRTYHYEENALPNVTPRTSPGYRPHTSTNAGYQFGAGVDYILCDWMTFGAGVQYGYYGQLKTGRGKPTQNLTGYNYADQRLKYTVHGTSVMFTLTSIIF